MFIKLIRFFQSTFFFVGQYQYGGEKDKVDDQGRSDNDHCYSGHITVERKRGSRKYRKTGNQNQGSDDQCPANSLKSINH